LYVLAAMMGMVAVSLGIGAIVVEKTLHPPKLLIVILLTVVGIALGVLEIVWIGYIVWHL
jgi:CBS-domain-containing membrane protein